MRRGFVWALSLVSVYSLFLKIATAKWEELGPLKNWFL